MEHESEVVPVEDVVDLAGAVRKLTTTGWPSGYVFGATRYADVILRESFSERARDLEEALSSFSPTLDELRSGGGGRTVFVKRFDDSLGDMVSDEGAQIWGKQNISISKSIALDGTTLRTTRTRGHEIDMFGKGTLAEPIPGIAVEMEWNNKDPFYDRDLINFQALHHEGAIAIGVIVTRGPQLQALISSTVRSKEGGFKYGQSSTHWDKLIPKVNLGGGGECPLLLIGIEPERISGVELAVQTKEALEVAESFRATWRESYSRWSDAKPIYDQMVETARDLMPPLKETKSTDADDN